MAKLYPKRGVWYAWGYDAKGRRWIRSTRQRERRAAIIVARRIERDVVGADDSASHASATLGEAVIAFRDYQRTSGRMASTLVSSRVKSGHLVRFFGASFDIAGFVPPEGSQRVSEYVRARVDEGAARSTIALEVVILKASLRNAARKSRWRGDTRAIEAPELKNATRPRRSWALPEALAKVTRETPPQWRDHVETWAGTGARRMELYQITAADLDARGNRVHLRGTKTQGADRWVPMSPRVRAILLRRARATPQGQLFREWTRAAAELPEICARAAVQRLMVSDLRRTFASTAISNGVSASVLKELMGHTTTKQIDVVYGHASEEARQDAVARVARAVAIAGRRGGTKGASGTGSKRKKR